MSEHCKLAISTMSLGWCHAGHRLEHRLDMAAQHGYQGIELFHLDLQDVCDRLVAPTAPTAWDRPTRERRAALLIRDMCRTRGLAILSLQPLMHFEGLADRTASAARLAQLAHWLSLAAALAAPTISIPSTFLPAADLSSDPSTAVADLRAAADCAAAHDPPVRLAYEALAWGTRVDSWEACWEVVRAVDRPNFGMCLDTFNMAARLYADPAVAGGVQPRGAQAVSASLRRLVRTVDVRKVFYVQVVDAERLGGPLVEGHEFFREDQAARMSWSRNCRLFYGEEARGAYLPIKEIAAAIFHGLGFEGWVSMELFNRRIADEDAGVPRELAARGAVAWEKLLCDMDAEGKEEAQVVRAPELAASTAATSGGPLMGVLGSGQQTEVHWETPGC